MGGRESWQWSASFHYCRILHNHAFHPWHHLDTWFWLRFCQRVRTRCWCLAGDHCDVCRGGLWGHGIVFAGAISSSRLCHWFDKEVSNIRSVGQSYGRKGTTHYAPLAVLASHLRIAISQLRCRWYGCFVAGLYNFINRPSSSKRHACVLGRFGREFGRRFWRGYKVDKDYCYRWRNFYCYCCWARDLLHAAGASKDLRRSTGRRRARTGRRGTTRAASDCADRE
mmetsp:Transcript_87234/g.251930  ORF Transcript_87234/g.251930 Transcript_87234/m.251930 type:complete len:225 (+) Transcript_87234:329-1003(+)